MNAKLPWTDYHSTGEDEDGYDHKCKWMILQMVVMVKHGDWSGRVSHRVKHGQTCSNMARQGQAGSGKVRHRQALL